jgi:glycosyltransferase involved in cell wall biosynthesis
MANQTRQLCELLEREGAKVTAIAVNAPHRPRWIGRIRGVRALFRLVPYVGRVWRIAGDVDCFHVMANSGWSWHLFAAPAVWIGSLRGVPTVVNYRGGEAETFLARCGTIVPRTLQRAAALVVPSGFLQQIFARRGLASLIVPNIIDTEWFHPPQPAQRPALPHLVVARNLEAIYDIGTALRAFAIVHASVPAARLTVAGEGPERRALTLLTADLGITGAVDFCGSLDRTQMASLYRSASVAVNPSRVDNMPNSVLEAMASGVPVVSTRVGGVPFIVRDGVTGLLVPAGDHARMARAILTLLDDAAAAECLRQAALGEIQQYTWPRVREQWAAVYEAAIPSRRVQYA